MAISLITQPGSGTPTTNTDYTNQNLLINGSIAAPESNLITDWAATATTPAPAVAQGVHIRHAGNLYVVDTSDEPITGTIFPGFNYLKLSVSGTTLTASWSAVKTGYTYNEAYGGWYSGTDQLIFNGVWYEGTTYTRYVAIPSPYLSDSFFYFADGKVSTNNNELTTRGSTFTTEGGLIDSRGGIIQSGGAIIDSEGGIIRSGSATIDSEGGTIQSGSGTIDSEGGTIQSGGGLIDSEGGNIDAGTGDITGDTIRATSYLGTAVGASPGAGDGQNGDIVIGVDRIYCKTLGTWRYALLT